MQLNWHSSENTSIGRFSTGALFSSQMREGHGMTGMEEPGEAMVNIVLPVTSLSMMAWISIGIRKVSVESHIDLHVLANSTLTAVR